MNSFQATRAVQIAEAQASKALREDRAMASSAQLCAVDARKHLSAGDSALAGGWAVRSLKYSLGILSPVYQEFAAMDTAR